MTHFNYPLITDVTQGASKFHRFHRWLYCIRA